MTRDREVLAQREQERDIPVLKTERLKLRAPCLRDVSDIARFAGDLRIAENTVRVPHPYTSADAQEFVATVNRHDTSTTFVITLDDSLIGVCGLDRRGGVDEIGYWLGAPYWGRGYTTEAVRAVIDHAFGELRYESLEAGARVNNPASRRVLEKCGFQWVRVRLTRIPAIKSAAPVDRFRLDRGLWASLKAWGRVREVA